MTLLIVMSLLLALVQIWFLPMLFSLNSMAYLLSNREEPNADQSAICARALRAAATPTATAVGAACPRAPVVATHTGS